MEDKQAQIKQFNARARTLNQGAKELVDQARELVARTNILSERANYLMNTSKDVYQSIPSSNTDNQDDYLTTIITVIQNYGISLFQEQEKPDSRSAGTLF